MAGHLSDPNSTRRTEASSNPTRPVRGATKARNGPTAATRRLGRKPDHPPEAHQEPRRRDLPRKVARALDPVHALHAYLDTVLFFLHRPLTRREKLHLDAAGFDTSGDGRRYVTPKHQRYGRRLLRVQRPTDEQFLAFIEMDVPHHVSWVDPALDLLVHHEREALALHRAFLPHWVQPDHRGHEANAVSWRDDKRRPEHFYEPSFYFDRDATAGRNGIVYPLRFGKGTPGPKLHCEPRMRAKRACEAWSLFDARDVREADLFTILGDELELLVVTDPEAFDRHVLDHFQKYGRSELGRLVEHDRHDPPIFDIHYPPRSLVDVKRHGLGMVMHDTHHHALVRKFDLGPIKYAHNMPAILMQECFPYRTLKCTRRIAVLELFLDLPLTLGNSPESRHWDTN